MTRDKKHQTVTLPSLVRICNPRPADQGFVIPFLTNWVS